VGYRGEKKEDSERKQSYGAAETTERDQRRDEQKFINE
tara:strand:+ start:206 stop:319 length:114 start_codon:yes stop_codon:yes gene_type:complete